MNSQQNYGVLAEILKGRPSTKVSSGITSRWFDKSVARPLLRTYDKEIVPRLTEAAAGAGATFGSRLALMKARTLGDITTSMGAQLGQTQLANMNLNAQLQENALGRALQGIQLQDNLYRGLPINAALAFMGQQQVALSQVPTVQSQLIGMGAGAAGGALAGSMFGPLGTVVGGIGGALGGIRY